MGTNIKLRHYQRDSIDALYSYWRNGGKDPALIVAPTAAGKSLIMAKFIQEISQDWPGTRILLLSHVKELLTQDYQEIRQLWPEAPIGLYSAGLGRRDLHAPVLVAGIQSIDRHAHKLHPPPEIVIIDEAHLIPRRAETRYNRTLKVLMDLYPNLRVVGLTATPYRLDTGSLIDGKDALFRKIVYNIPVQMLIDEGYLSPITARAGAVSIDTTGVKHTGKEFAAGDLERHAMAGDTTAQAVADMVRRAAARKKWLVFAAGVAHAHQISEHLEAAGISSEVITGATPTVERDRIVHNYKAGSIKALVNVSVLTTGFNVPAIDMIALMRPTESAGLYVQMIGRGMRLEPDKKDCLILDYSGNVLRHGPIDSITPKDFKDKGEGDAPLKECPVCHLFVHAGLRECPDCGHEFPERVVQIEPTHKGGALLKSELTAEWVDVDSATAHVHKKTGRPDSVRIEYKCGLNKYKEWIFPEADNERAAYFYHKWCRDAGIEDPPRTVAKFVFDFDIPVPTRIEIRPDGKYIRVTRRDYGDL